MENPLDLIDGNYSRTKDVLEGNSRDNLLMEAFVDKLTIKQLSRF